MKVFAFTLFCIALSVAAVPIELESDDNTQLTLADTEFEPITDEISTEDVARSKRFILKKLALAKVGVLGIGALGAAGVAKSALGGMFTGGAHQQHPQPTPSQYGQAYNYQQVPVTYTTTQYQTIPAQSSYVPSQNVAPTQYTSSYNTAAYNTESVQPVQYQQNLVASGSFGVSAPSVGYAAAPSVGYAPAGPAVGYAPAPAVGYAAAPAVGYAAAPAVGYAAPPPSVNYAVQNQAYYRSAQPQGLAPGKQLYVVCDQA